MGVGILDNALSGLAAFQRSLETTSNNISNVGTEGYSRQRVDLATRREQYTGAGWVGNGVATANITRSYDQFISNQVRASKSAFGEVDTYHALASQIDNIIADPDTGFAPELKKFFDAAHGVANDPTSVPARQTLVSEADLLAQNLNTMGTRFTEMRNQVNQDLGSKLNDISDYAKSIAELNVKIAADAGRASGKQLPNDLMDQRDLLLNKIAEKVDVSVVDLPDGTASVFIGQGQPLVVGTYASTLTARGSAEDPFHKDIFLNGQNVTKQISGGELAGSLRFRDEVLDPAQQQLGLLAAGIAIDFNIANQGGFDLNGAAGGSMFSLSSPQIPVTSNNSTAGLTATYSGNPANLEAEDYRVVVTATIPATTYSLTRVSDGSAVTLPSTNVGFNLNFDGTEAIGDSFLVRPTYSKSLDITAQITDPRKIAASQTAGGVPGDNRNALKMANFETQKKMLGGNASYSEGYGQLVSQIGTLTHSAQVSQAAQDVLLKQATSAQESSAGVNLDEEAANLIKFQNAYQASARIISVVNSMFDSLMGAVR